MKWVIENKLKYYIRNCHQNNCEKLISEYYFHIGRRSFWHFLERSSEKHFLSDTDWMALHACFRGNSPQRIATTIRHNMWIENWDFWIVRHTRDWSHARHAWLHACDVCDFGFVTCVSSGLWRVLLRVCDVCCDFGFVTCVTSSLWRVWLRVCDVCEFGFVTCVVTPGLWRVLWLRVCDVCDFEFVTCVTSSLWP